MDLVETILHPGALEIRDQIGEDVQEFREQLSKQNERLAELREKKRTDPGAVYCLGTRLDLLIHAIS